MKRRWAVVAVLSLACLIGWSWLAARFGMSTWDLGGIRMVGMVVACFATFHAMRRDLRVKWPAVVAFAGCFPMLVLAVPHLSDLSDFVSLLGPSIVLVFFGSIAAAIGALFIMIAPLPPPPAPPPVAPARVVED